LIRAFHLPITGAAVVYAALFLLALVNLGNILPAAPGYAGSFEFFSVQALTTFSAAVEPGAALALAVISHAYQYALITGLGLFFLWRMGLSLRVLQQVAKEEAQAAPES
jgi:hypothetical protein